MTGEHVCFIDGDPDTADIMFVGEAPGKEDAALKRSFVGRSGRLLWSIGKKAGVDRSTCLTTHAVQAWPSLKSGKPSKAQLYSEWDRLDDELRSFKGEVLVLVGGVPLWRVTGLVGGILKWRGYVLTPDDIRPVERKQRVKVGEYKTSCKNPDGSWKYQKGDPKYANRLVASPSALPPNVKYIIPILHPDGILNSQCTTITALKADLQRASRARDGLDPLSRVHYTTLPCMPDHHVTRVTIDIETPMHMRVIERVACAWHLNDGNIHTWTAPWNATTAHVVKEIMADESLVKSFHNRSFDVPILEEHGCPAKGVVVDTMWGAQLLNPDLRKGLGSVAPLYLDMRPWKDTSTDDPEHYNAKDAHVQEALSAKIFPLIKQTGQDVVFMAQMRGLPIVEGMHKRGIRCHRERTTTWLKEQEDRLIETAMRWPWPEINHGSPKQLTQHLYYKLYLPIQLDKRGNPTSDEAAITNIIRHMDATEDSREEIREGLQALLDLREINRNIKYYGKVVIGEDDCVHPEYLPADREESGAKDRGQGARTGRIQPRNPNIANQHLDARRLYVPRHDDWAFASIDWQQAEAYFDAVDAQDTALLEALESGLHSYIQEGIARMVGEKVERVEAKMTWYATRNMAAPRTICQQLRRAGRKDATTARCKEIQDGLFKLFPRWAARRYQIIAEAEARQYVQEPFGRRYPVYMKGRLRPRIVGFRPQAAVGHMLWDRLPIVDAIAQRHGGHLVLTVHDEFIPECPVDRVEDMAAETQEALECEWPQVAKGFRLKTDAEIGRAGESWGDLNMRYKT